MNVRKKKKKVNKDYLIFEKAYSVALRFSFLFTCLPLGKELEN